MSNQPPVFVLAPRYGRELAAIFAGIGVPAQFVSRAGDAATAFAVSSCRIVVIDARGSLATTLIAAHEIAPVVEARHGALVVLLAKGDSGGVASAYAAGATHAVAGTLGPADLADALRFARRMAERIADVAAGHVALSGGDVHRDALTGLASAHHAHSLVDLLLGGVDAAARPAAVVVLIAIGRFAQVNAAYGRTAADAVLFAVAERLERVVAEAREADRADARLLARMAGAEFGIVLPSPARLDDALALARRIVAAFDAPFALGARAVHLAVRAGIATAGGGGRPGDGGAERLFRRAGAALNRARAGEPGRIEVFAPVAGGDPETRLADLETDLRRALDDDALAIFYQPQVEIATGRIAGVEALVRWTHPDLGAISAGTLFEIADRAELAAVLGSHLRAKALREAAAWPKTLAGLRLSLNVGAGDLRSGDFARDIDAALATSGFPAMRLTLEITEGDLIANLDAAADVLGALRDRGTHVALDDFGTGYSSLGYLKALPLDCLKLDKTLTDDLVGNPRDRIVVRGVVDMARALGIQVTAEGVETEAELDLVRAARCDWYQGFLCAPGLPGDALAGFVAGWRG